MSLARPTRLANPRLGLLFGVYASALIAVGLVVLLLEQLGIGDGVLRAAMFGLPAALFLGVGTAAMTRDSLDFHAAGRRVPPFFSGLATAVSALGGFGLVVLTGCVFLMGSDAFALLLGLPAGMVVMAVLLVPFLRKVGAPTVSGFLGRRLDSPFVRICAAATLSVPMLLALVAEIKLAGFVGATLTGLPTALLAIVATVSAAVIVGGGGMRALTWSTAAKATAVLLAIVVPVTIVSLIVSSLPFPQMSAGNVARQVMRSELFRSVPTLLVAPWVFEVPTDGLVPLTKRLVQSHGHIGSLASSLSILIIMAGIAGSPTLLARAGTTPSVHAARSSMSWAVLVTGFILLTLVAIAVFLRGRVADQVLGQAADRLPSWFRALQNMGAAAVDAKSGDVRLSGVSFHRDLILSALPIAFSLPAGLAYLTLTGAFAACLAAIGAHLLALGTTLSQDVILGPDSSGRDGRTDVLLARIGVAVVAVVGVAISLLPADPLQLMLWSLALSASASFPVLVLAVLWKRLNALGAVAGMVTGFGVCTTLILSERMGLGVLAGPLPAAIAIPAATLAAIAVTLLTPAVGRHTLEMVRDMRVPGGETIVDREARLLRLQRPG